MSTDFARERARFPIFAERVYSASQCLGPCPDEMFADLEAYRRTLVRRSRSLEEWLERHEAIHGQLEQLLEAPADSVFIRDSATAVQASIASCLEPEGARRRIVISSGDFHSTRFLWHAQAERGFELVEVASNGPAHGDAQTFLEAIDQRTAVVALSLVSPRSGALLQVREIAARARDVGAVVVIDAYQAVGIVPIRVHEMGAHVIVGGTHKWLCGGGAGLAFGYVEPSLAERLRPAYPGWIGHAALRGFEERFRPHAGARRFEQGTPALEPIYTARAGLGWVLEVGIDALRARSVALTERVVRGASERGLTVRSPIDAERRGGMVCLELADASAVVTTLERAGIDVDARPGAGLRVGPHPCQTDDEIDHVVDSIARAVGR